MKSLMFNSRKRQLAELDRLQANYADFLAATADAPEHMADAMAATDAALRGPIDKLMAELGEVR